MSDSDITKHDVDKGGYWRDDAKPTDSEATQRIVAQTRNANAQLLKELGEIGVKPEFTVHMLAVYFDGLVKVGVLSREDLLVIEKSWEQQFHQILSSALDKTREAIQKAQTQAQLTLPPGASLTPPPNSRHIFRPRGS